MFWEGGTHEQISHVKLEFENFAYTTYEALLKVETFESSSLEHICRLDISVMINLLTNHFEYFINKVKRGTLICLFGYMVDNTFTPQLVGDQTRKVIEQYLDGYYNCTWWVGSAGRYSYALLYFCNPFTPVIQCIWDVM